MPFIERASGQDYVTMAGGVGVAIVVTSPANGSTVTDANISVTWTATPSLVAYRIRITDSSTFEVVYSTDWIVRAATGWNFGSSGFLESGKTYTLSVDGVSLAGDSSSHSTEFTTDFATGSRPNNFIARTVGMKGAQDTKVLPRVIITWDEFIETPGSDESFTQQIWRQMDDEPWQFIGLGTQNRYEDANVCSGHSYRYKMGIEHVILIPPFSTPKNLFSFSDPTSYVKVEFEHCFIHEVGSLLGGNNGNLSANYPFTQPLFVRFESWEHSRQMIQDTNIAVVSGRTRPIARFTERGSRVFSVRGLPTQRTNRTIIDQLDQMLLRQRENGNTFCIRFGRSNEIAFGVIDGLLIQEQQKTTATSFTFTETYYDERYEWDAWWRAVSEGEE